MMSNIVVDEVERAERLPDREPEVELSPPRLPAAVEVPGAPAKRRKAVSRAWVITGFPRVRAAPVGGFPTLEEFSEEVSKVVLDDINGCVFAVFQIERCPETARLHLQGYVRFGAAISLDTLKKRLPDAFGQVHAEIRRGTDKQAIEYCRKEESRAAGPWELGKGPTVLFVFN